MLSGIESLRRRRVHSEDALDSMRLKSSRSGYLSRVTTLCRAAEVLLNDSKNVNEVSKKLLEIEEAFSRFEKAHYDYVLTLSAGDLEELECQTRYFKEHFHRKWRRLRESKDGLKTLEKSPHLSPRKSIKKMKILMYCNTQVESDQNVDWLIGISSCSLTVWSN